MTVTPGSAGLLAKRCQEILDWKSSGLLADGELRKMAEALENVPDTYRLSVAEAQTATEAMQEVVRLAAKPAEEAVEPEELESLIADRSANRAADLILANYVVTRRCPTGAPKP